MVPCVSPVSFIRYFLNQNMVLYFFDGIISKAINNMKEKTEHSWSHFRRSRFRIPVLRIEDKYISLFFFENLEWAEIWWIGIGTRILSYATFAVDLIHFNHGKYHQFHWFTFIGNHGINVSKSASCKDASLIELLKNRWLNQSFFFPFSKFKWWNY